MRVTISLAVQGCRRVLDRLQAPSVTGVGAVSGLTLFANASQAPIRILSHCSQRSSDWRSLQWQRVTCQLGGRSSSIQHVYFGRSKA